MLALLWTFQVVLLDQFYKGIKTRDINAAADTLVRSVSSSISSTELDEQVQSIAARNELCVYITRMQNLTTPIASADTLPNCRIHRMSPIELARLYLAAAENGGTYVERSVNTPGFVVEGDGFRFFVPKQDEIESLILVRVIQQTDGNDLILYLNSTISPVDATVRTLQVQLLFVTAIMIVVSLILSLILSRRLALPIARINETAKQFAKGNYDVRFDGKGYREISELNSTLNYTAKELSKAEGLRRELLANISHDLRTPLTMIIGYSEMMRDIPSENTPENIQVVIDEASRLTRLVNDLLDLSKLQAGVQELTVIRLNLTEMINGILLRYAKLTEQDGYQIVTEVAPDIWVDADESKLSQVIYNLINNAVNYTGSDKKITVRLFRKGEAARVEIVDTGIGIPVDQIDAVWERYYKIDRNHKRAAVGTGLGLSIVKNVLELHKAAYGVDSIVGKGSTFWFELPLSSEKA
ncbi:MAG TPA: HAMP domain-containing histidine kinase [Candidatus Merdivicinus faecavium]|nr:HAMP domain-containing histidine kinase [Candidatus Merdivicinus faecavium]